MKNREFKDGFIDLQMNNYIVRFREKYVNEYDVVKELYEIFKCILDELGKKGELQQNVYIMASITQLYKLYQSAIILLERGLRESANVLIRTILELSFKVIEVIRDKAFVDKFWLEQEYENWTTLKHIKENKLFHLVPEEQVNEHIEHYLQKTNGKNTKRTVTDMAKNNGLLEAYIIYRIQCKYTHQSTSVIEGIIKRDGDRCYIDGNLQLNDFKESVAFLISIVIIPLPILFDEYLDNKELIEVYEMFCKKYEKVFDNI